MPRDVYRVIGRTKVQPENLPEGLEVRKISVPIHEKIPANSGDKFFQVYEHMRESKVVVGKLGGDLVVLSVEGARAARDALTQFIDSHTPDDEPAPVRLRVFRADSHRFLKVEYASRGFFLFEVTPGKLYWGKSWAEAERKATRHPNQVYLLRQAASHLLGLANITDSWEKNPGVDPFKGIDPKVNTDSEAKHNPIVGYEPF